MAAAKVETAFVWSPEYSLYNLGKDHPFQAVRGELTLSLLQHCGAISPEHVHAPCAVSEAELLKTHSPQYVQCVQDASQGRYAPNIQEFGLNTDDTPAFAGMHQATLKLVGGSVQAADLVLSGQYQRSFNVGGGLHHAQRNKAAGFCVYSDLSAAARRFTEKGLRVVYLDIDAHHGDGVQWLHYQDPEVLTISLHETGRFLWPGTGATYELGRDAGNGYSLNVPLEPFTQDDSFLEVLDMVLPEVLAWYQPHVLLLQAGCDPHQQDPLADLCLTVQGMTNIYDRLVHYADMYCEGRIVATGGGGYATYNVAARAWAQLYASLQGISLPETIPTAWLEQWQAPNPTEDPLPTGWWDEAVNIPRKTEIEQRNRRVTERLLRDWRSIHGI